MNTEPDSDFDFNPGAYAPENALAQKHIDPKRRKRRQEALGVSSKRPFKRRKFHTNNPEGPNQLLKYFGVEDLESSSESDLKTADRATENVLLSSDGEVDSEGSPPVVLKSIAALSKANPNSSRPTSPRITLPAPQDQVADDSITESESEEDKNTLLSGNPTSEADSETETDSGDDSLLLVRKPLRNLSASCSSSATESDTDEDLRGALDDLKPRPGFPLGFEQQHHKPFILDEGAKIQVPASINTYLRDYQREGVKFLWRQYQEGRGGLLGDDMGLVSETASESNNSDVLIHFHFQGKTIQVISFLSAVMCKSGVVTDKDRRRKHVSRLQDRTAWTERRELPPADSRWPTCLIIAPSTIVPNWERELATWGYFEIGLYAGGRKEREPVLHDFRMGRLDIVVTSFEIARKDIDLLDSLPWSCIFVDEVHRVKNVSSKLTLALHQFTSGRRFGLTGTMIQNSYQEMWTILDWTNPGQLGTSRQWYRLVVKPLTTGQSAAATEEERAKAQMVAQVLKNKLLPEFFLRRTKEIIRDQLPKKTDQVVFCPLSQAQIVGYKRILDMDAVQNLIHREDPCPCGSNISVHQTARNRALTDIVFPSGSVPKYGTAMMQPRYCGKWATLEILLHEWSKDSLNKVLIFTKSVKLLDMLDFHLKAQGYGFVKLEGSTKQSDRMPMIDKFQKDPKVFIFLISTLAGGTGLNLTGANKVVIFDPNWNPAHDLQAMDRAFRFGQTRDVSVYRLLGAGSVEELIYARQIYKQQQMEIGYNASIQTRYFEGIQGDNAKQGELFGIANIFKLHEDQLATKMAIEKANLAELDWALANMGSRRSQKANKSAVEMIEAGARASKEDSTLKGLSALLFDDEALRPSNLSEGNSIQTMLNTIGVKYSHHNDEVLLPSRIEEERTKKTLMKVRQKRQAKGRHSRDEKPRPQEQWPPIRRHHKSQPRLSPEEQLASRHNALVQLGMVDSPEEVPLFAREFAKQSLEAQNEIIAELDKWVRLQEADSD
ncbi:hypothetical protein Ac2012v2_006079 [Leucoagaricus gongylophorus]